MNISLGLSSPLLCSYSIALHTSMDRTETLSPQNFSLVEFNKNDSTSQLKHFNQQLIQLVTLR